MFKRSKRRDAQSQEGGKLNSKSIVRIAISLMVAIIAFVGLTTFESYVLSDKDTKTVIVASKNIPSGTFIDDGNRDTFFAEKVVNATLVTDTTFKKIEDIEGKILTDVSAGEIMTQNRLFNTAYVNQEFSDPVMVSFAILAAEDGLNGHIRKGDLVDLIYTNKNDLGENASAKFLENVYIINAYDASYTLIEDEDLSTQAMYFDIYLEHEEAEYFNTIANNSNISIVKLTNN